MSNSFQSIPKSTKSLKLYFDYRDVIVFHSKIEFNKKTRRYREKARENRK